MELSQSWGKYSRLQDELALALAKHPANVAKIERLAEELVFTERAIADSQPIDEQCGESLFGWSFQGRLLAGGGAPA